MATLLRCLRGATPRAKVSGPVTGPEHGNFPRPPTGNPENFPRDFPLWTPPWEPVVDPLTDSPVGVPGGPWLVLLTERKGGHENLRYGGYRDTWQGTGALTPERQSRHNSERQHIIAGGTVNGLRWHVQRKVRQIEHISTAYLKGRNSFEQSKKSAENYVEMFGRGYDGKLPPVRYPLIRPSILLSACQRPRTTGSVLWVCLHGLRRPRRPPVGRGGPPLCRGKASADTKRCNVQFTRRK